MKRLLGLLALRLVMFVAVLLMMRLPAFGAATSGERATRAERSDH